MITLGIETSCDETALSLIETRGSYAAGDFEVRVIASLIHSQAELHSAYGGVFPMLAKREHGKNMTPLLEQILKSTTARGTLKDEEFGSVIESLRAEMESKDPDLFGALEAAEFLKNIPNIGQIAVTEGPGLEPTLWVGINAARILGKLWCVPVIPVNHMEGHVVASLLGSDTSNGQWQKLKELPLPSIALLISGGHTELIKLNKLGDYECIGQTKDDAVGEAFDKVARLLSLPYPGGPHISKLSYEAMQEGITPTVKLPRPMIASKDHNFSFSGLKTAVLYAVREELERTGTEQLPDASKKGIALEFERAVTETLETKLQGAIESTGAQSVIIGGGVSANRMLRESFKKIGEEYSIPVYLPSTHTSGDNALMIALAGALHGKGVDRPLKAEGTKRLA
ncbi:MAG: tRNA (adenosine(37)-N6)-threonylcarbamoyltransferase complex transferase subunit TsaD [Patescibacteria group bacterium]